jgi:glycosyltransferase involved in cell wall biosynthesis
MESGRSMMRPEVAGGKPRVLLIDLGANFGGVESYLVSLAGLLASDMELYVLCVLPELSARLSSCGAKVIRLPVFRGIFKPLRFLTALMILPLLLLRYRIRTVQLNGFLESILILLARLLGRSAVYTRHGPFEIELYSWLRQPLKFLARRIARWSVRFTTHVVCVSQAVAESVRPVLPATRYSVISNWVSGQKPFRAPLADLQTPVRVLCVSRLEHYKGVHLLIEAARRLPAVEVTIIGDGSDRTSLQKFALGIPNVRLAGFQRNIEEFYERADIFVMPSMGPEGLPITSLEAMAHGLPCIFSDLPVHHEITDDGKGASLFRSGEVESLVAALRDLLASSERRQRYAAEAHRIVATRYNEGNVRQAYLRVLLGGRLHEYSIGFRRANAPVNPDLHTAPGE